MTAVRAGVGGDSGSVTAEFAVVVPAVLVLVAGAVGALAVAGEAIRLTDAAGLAARATGRGDSARAAEAVERLAPGATSSVESGDVLCVRLDRVVRLGFLPGGVPLSATSCALDGGE